MEYLNTQAAGELLQAEIPEKPGYWQQFLINNRRADRDPPYRLSFTRYGKAALYTREELAKFLKWEKSRRIGTVKLTGRAAEVIRAFGIGESSGSNYGRQLDYHATLHNDPVAEQLFVSLQVSDPFLVFKIPIDQARQLVKELEELVEAAERIGREGQ